MKNSVFDNAFLETADVAFSLPPMEMHKGKDSVVEYASKNSVSHETIEQMHSALVNAPKWLPFSSKVFHTSSDVSDYFTVPTIIMPTDLPNRNLTAFPRSELIKFDPEIGGQVYSGWIGKPVYYNHQNLDYTKAIGTVVDVSMRRMPGTAGDLWKVIALMAIDRTKNTKLAHDILSGRRRNYSMGAMVKSYQCSICGCTGQIKAGMKDKYECMPCGKSHAFFDRAGKFRSTPLDRNGDVKTIGFLNAIGVKPFEISTVDYPAFASAYTPESAIQEL